MYLVYCNLMLQILTAIYYGYQFTLFTNHKLTNKKYCLMIDIKIKIYKLIQKL